MFIQWIPNIGFLVSTLLNEREREQKKNCWAHSLSLALELRYYGIKNTKILTKYFILIEKYTKSIIIT